MIVNHKSVADNVFFIQKVYMANSVPSSKNYESLALMSKISFLLYKTILTLVFCTVCIFASMPFLLYLYEGTGEDGQLAPMIPFYVPFVNENTFGGYIILCGVHVYALYLTVLGVTGGDATIIVLAVHGLALADIFENGFLSLNNIVNQNRRGNDIEVKFTLRNLVQMHIEAYR